MPKVRVVSLSNAQRAEAVVEVERAADWARRVLGWQVELCDGIADRHPWGGAGDPALRAERLMGAIEAADAVMCSGGGAHGIELLPHLDVGRLAGGVFVGTSDNSMLAVALAGLGARTFCGPDLRLSATHEPQVGDARPLDFPYSKHSLAGLFGPPGWRDVSPPPGRSGLSLALRPGDASGPLVAVHLASLLRLTGTPWWPAKLLDGALLCIERQSAGADDAVADLVTLHETGVLGRLSALCIGWLDGLDHDPEASQLDRVLIAARDLTADSQLPIFRLGVFGHRCPHAVLPIGVESRLRDGRLFVKWPRMSGQALVTAS